MIGSVYGGPRDDFGWNQAHAVAAKALKQVPGVKVVEEENVPETDACAKSMESMINLDAAELIFGTSFGYFDPFMIDLAKNMQTSNSGTRIPSLLAANRVVQRHLTTAPKERSDFS